MYDYSYNSANKRGPSEDVTYLPTAEKDRHAPDNEQYFERTPEKQFTSPRRQGSRLSDAKRSIDECIYMASDKKKMNQEALSEVFQVNTEIISSFTAYNPAKHNSYEHRNKTDEQNKRDNFRENVTTSQFEWRPTTSPKGLFQENSKDTFGNQENVDLGARLNHELRKNKDMAKYISSLEAELSTMRVSKAQSGSNGSINEVMEENRYLRSQLANSQAQLPSHLLDDLEKLKYQNSGLRKDTISLLRAKKG